MPFKVSLKIDDVSKTSKAKHCKAAMISVCVSILVENYKVIYGCTFGCNIGKPN